LRAAALTPRLNRESATFTVYTDAFERYLNYRGVFEAPPRKDTSSDAEERENPFPVQHPWWFRTVSPDGWKAVKGGILWTYGNYKPQDSIVIRYYMTEFPQSSADVDVFVDRILKRLGKNESEAAALTKVREVLLATYGKEPADLDARDFVERQLWYSPRKDFSQTSLSSAQRAVLRALDAKIAEVGKTRGANRNER